MEQHQDICQKAPGEELIIWVNLTIAHFEAQFADSLRSLQTYKSTKRPNYCFKVRITSAKNNRHVRAPSNACSFCRPSMWQLGSYSISCPTWKCAGMLLQQLAGSISTKDRHPPAPDNCRPGLGWEGRSSSYLFESSLSFYL